MLKSQQVELKEANEFVSKLHRHHKPVIGHRFSVGVSDGESLCGVAIVGRPVARGCNNKTTLEVTRLCTNGTKNACSYLYSLCARIAKDLGYEKIQTYILETESGTSLKASGWQLEETIIGRPWVHTAGPRRQDQPICNKQRWSKIVN